MNSIKQGNLISYTQTEVNVWFGLISFLTSIKIWNLSALQNPPIWSLHLWGQKNSKAQKITPPLPLT
jgi:hypothetical protein